MSGTYGNASSTTFVARSFRWIATKTAAAANRHSFSFWFDLFPFHVCLLTHQSLVRLIAVSIFSAVSIAVSLLPGFPKTLLPWWLLPPSVVLVLSSHGRRRPFTTSPSRHRFVSIHRRFDPSSSTSTIVRIPQPPQDFIDARAVPPIFLQHCGHHVAQKGRVARGYWGVLFSADRRRQTHQVLCRKGMVQRTQFVQHHAEGPNVGQFVVGLVGTQFRRGIQRRAVKGLQHDGLHAQFTAHAQITQFVTPL